MFHKFYKPCIRTSMNVKKHRQLIMGKYWWYQKYIPKGVCIQKEDDLDEENYDHSEPQFINCQVRPYGFDTKARYYIKRYLDNRKQRVYVHRNFSSW